MANNPYNNKIIYNGTTLIDLTDATATADKILEGYTAYGASGAKLTGTATGGGVVIEDTIDSHGGTIRTITTTNVVNLGPKSITQNGTYTASTDNLNGYSQVTVNVEGGGTVNLQTKTDIDPTTSSQTITPDSGYDGLASVQINPMPSGSATTPATTITANPSISVNSSGLITATASASQSVTPTVSAGYVSSGTAGTVSVSGSNTQQLTTQAAKTVTPTKSSQTAVAAGRYTTGAVTVAAIPAEYITTADATASASDIALGETAYVNGSKVTGTLSFVTYYTGSSTPSASQGSNGDIYLKVVT